MLAPAAAYTLLVRAALLDVAAVELVVVLADVDDRAAEVDATGCAWAGVVRGADEALDDDEELLQPATTPAATTRIRARHDARKVRGSTPSP
jgi:hypothetical protein